MRWDCIPVYLIQLVWITLSPLIKIGRNSKYLLAIYVKWLNLFWLTIILNFSIKFTNSLRELRIVLNSLLPTLVFIWTKYKQSFIKLKTLKPYYGSSTLMIYFFIWTYGEEQLKTFINNSNNYKSNLKFTYEYSKSEINFLDLKLKFKKWSFTISVHRKATDRHQYLHYHSFDPCHIKKSVIYS